MRDTSLLHSHSHLLAMYILMHKNSGSAPHTAY